MSNNEYEHKNFWENKIVKKKKLNYFTQTEHSSSGRNKKQNPLEKGTKTSTKTRHC